MLGKCLEMTRNVKLKVAKIRPYPRFNSDSSEPDFFPKKYNTTLNCFQLNLSG